MSLVPEQTDPMTNKPEIKVLFLTRYPVEGASSRYRVFQYLPYLSGMNVTCDVQSFMNSALYKLSTTPGKSAQKVLKTAGAVFDRLGALSRWKQYDIIYMQRELFPFGPPILERWLKKKGAVLFFDYDDALFIKKSSRYNPIATMLRSPKKTMETMALVDCVVAGNNWLRDSATEFGANAVTVEVAEDTDRIKMHPTHTNAAPVTVGWLGSPSTVKYLNLIAPVLQRVAAEFPNLRFEIMGGGEFEMDGVDWTLTDWSLAGELDVLQRFDIGLMPLPNEDWARGKSGGKARTYMAAGVVPVCADIGYNSELIRNGDTGFLCREEEDWYTAIKGLVESDTLRQKIALAARADVEMRFKPASQAARLRELFETVLADRAQGSA